MSETSSNCRYVVITPVRDEESKLPRTLNNMIGLTIRPSELLIVNDGSADNTAQILDVAAADHPWINPVHRKTAGSASPAA